MKIKLRPPLLLVLLLLQAACFIGAGIGIGIKMEQKAKTGNDLFSLGWLTGYKQGMLHHVETKEEIFELLKSDSTEVFNKLNQ